MVLYIYAKHKEGNAMKISLTFRRLKDYLDDMKYRRLENLILYEVQKDLTWLYFQEQKYQRMLLFGKYSDKKIAKLKAIIKKEVEFLEEKCNDITEDYSFLFEEHVLRLIEDCREEALQIAQRIGGN